MSTLTQQWPVTQGHGTNKMDRHRQAASTSPLATDAPDAHWRVQRWAQGWGSGAVRPETCNRQGNLQGMGGAPWGKAKRLVPSGVSDPVAICPASLPHTSIKR